MLPFTTSMRFLGKKEISLSGDGLDPGGQRVDQLLIEEAGAKIYKKYRIFRKSL
jgi:hypothetical protein